MTTTAVKLARQALVLDRYGEGVDFWYSNQGEIDAEFAMSWVSGGGAQEDISAARRQILPVRTAPPSVEVVDAYSRKAATRAALVVAAAPADEPF